MKLSPRRQALLWSASGYWFVGDLGLCDNTGVVLGGEGKSVEVLLIGPKAFSTTQRTQYALTTALRVRQTLFLR